MSEAVFSARPRAKQLAEYLRAKITSGEISNPLPATRIWSRRLGVSRVVLGAAVQQLRREGWFADHARGVRLKLRRGDFRRLRSAPRQLVRVLLFQSYQPRLRHYLETYRAMSERISSLGADVQWEIVSAARLRELARDPKNQGVMVLLGVPLTLQRLMVQSGKLVLVIGDTPADLKVPSVYVDNAASVSHATNSLLRRGVDGVGLLYGQGAMLGTRRFVLSFSETCAKWPRQQVRNRLIPTALDRQSLDATARRLGFGLPARSGFVVMSPIPLGMVMTALLQRSLAGAGRFELASIGHHLEEAMLYPPPLHYPFPSAGVAKHIGNAIAHYLVTGRLPPLNKVIGLELAQPSGD